MTFALPQLLQAERAGRALAIATRAAPKPGLYCGRGPEFAGRVLLADIGVPHSLLA